MGMWDSVISQRPGAAELFTGIGAALLSAGSGGGAPRPRFGPQQAAMFQQAVAAPRQAAFQAQQGELIGHKIAGAKSGQAEAAKRAQARDRYFKAMQMGGKDFAGRPVNMNALAAEAFPEQAGKAAFANQSPKLPPGWTMGPDGRAMPVPGGPASPEYLEKKANIQQPFVSVTSSDASGNQTTKLIPREDALRLIAKNQGIAGDTTPDSPGAVVGQKPNLANLKKFQELQQKYGQVGDALATYKRLVNQHGAEIMPGAAKNELATAYENVRLEAKELFNLGVLNGPDLELITNLLRDPTSVSGKMMEVFGGGMDAFNKQIKIVEDKLSQARARASRLYGGGEKEVPESSPLPTPTEGGMNTLGRIHSAKTAADLPTDINKMTVKEKKALDKWLKDRGF